MTVKEYAAMRGISTQAVTKVLRAGGLPPGIKSFKMIGRIYILTPVKK